MNNGHADAIVHRLFYLRLTTVPTIHVVELIDLHADLKQLRRSTVAC
jgi:hypothetical protein